MTRRCAPRPSGAVAKALRRHPSPPMYSERPPETDVPDLIVLPIGGEGGIDSALRASPFGRHVRVVQNRLRRFCRTLDGLLTHTSLAGAHLRPLGHLSGQDRPIRGALDDTRPEAVQVKLKGPIASVRLSQTSSTILATEAPERDSWSSSRLMRS